MTINATNGSTSPSPTDIFNSSVAVSAISAAWELGALDELNEFGKLDAEDFAARHDLHAPSTNGMFAALAAVRIVDRRGTTVLTGPNFDEVYRSKGLFHWLGRGSADLFSRMAFVSRNKNRNGRFYQRDAAAISTASRDANRTFFDPAFWNVMSHLDFEPSAVADLGCGSAERLLQILRHYPRSRGLAIDLAPQALEVAAGNIEAAGLGDRVAVIEDDVRALSPRPDYAEVDLLTCFLMGHDLWPKDDCVVSLRRLRARFPNARRLVLGDNAKTTGIPDDRVPIFTLAFEVGHAMMGVYLPTVAEWHQVFEESGWRHVATHQVDSLAGAVIFELE